MAVTLDTLLHSLANRMQAAVASAGLLHLSGTLRDDSSAVALRQLMNELEAATAIVKAMHREYETAQSKKKSAAG